MITGTASATGDGIVERIRLVGEVPGSRTIQLLESQNYGFEIDPMYCAYSADLQHMVVYDYRNKLLRAQPWDGTTSLPAAGSWQTIASTATIPDLDRLQLTSLDDDLWLNQPFPMTAPRYKVEKPGSWQFIPVQALDHVIVANAMGLAAGHDVHVRLPVASSLELLDAFTDQVVYSVGGASGWNIIPGSVFSANSHYRVRINGERGLTVLSPIQRWGDTSTNAALSPIRVGRGKLTHPGPFLGNDEYAVRGAIYTLDADTSLPEVVFAVLMLGIFDGSPPVPYSSPGLAVMANPQVIAGPWPIVFDTSLPDYRASHALAYDHPVPNDPQLVGILPIYQWGTVSASTGEAAVSDVFGLPIY